MTLPFLIHLPETLPVTGQDDARVAEWVPLTELETLAFDHGAILCEALGRFWHHMPFASPMLSEVKGYGVPTAQTDTATFFGGSFNPWHDGHQACVASFPKEEHLIIVPDTNPFKAGPDDRCYWQEFRKICKQAGSRPVYPGFWGQESSNPTISWIGRTSYKNVGFLMGADSFCAFPNWTNATQLAGLLNHLYTVPRREEDADIQQSTSFFKQHAPDCRLHWLPDHPHRDVSSTALRANQPKYRQAPPS